jgi:hypothetical protein
MRWKTLVFLAMGAVALAGGPSCIDESPTAPATMPFYFGVDPGTQWTYQFVLNDSTRYWMTMLREEPAVLLGDTLWVMDYIADGVVTQTQYMDIQNGLVHVAGSRYVSFADTIVEIYDPPLRLSPSGRSLGENWATVGEVLSLKITASIPPDTIRTENPVVWRGRVLGEERIEVPAFDEPVDALMVEYGGELGPYATAGPQYVWLVENIGSVREMDLSLGRTVSDLSEYIPGK